MLRSNFVKLAFAIICAVVGYFSFTQVSAKIGSFNSEFSFSDEFLNPLSIRLFIWESSWNVVQKNMLLGVGTGDADFELIKEYERLNFRVGLRDKYNSHNMYLQYWLSNGIFALLAFCSILSLFVYKSTNKKNIPMLLFILVFLCFSLTESTMLKQRGIVFFLFFACFFMNNPKIFQLKNENNTSS